MNFTKYVGAYRIRPPQRRNCTYNDCGLLGVTISFSFIWGRMRYAPTLVRLKSWDCWVVRFCVFDHIRAYAIRPYSCSVEILGLLGSTFRAFSITSGRMRYAPTLDRLYLGVDESCASCIFAHIRAYAIRPYTCSVEILGLLGCTFRAFSLIWGRMRYARTFVRLKSWGCWVNTSCKFIRYKHHISVKFAKRCRGVSHTPFMAAKLYVRGWWFFGCYHFVFAHFRAYAIRPYTCSVEIEANYIATKPSNELQRCWYGSHKTLKWTHSALVRMWQNPQTIRDDAD